MEFFFFFCQEYSNNSFRKPKNKIEEINKYIDEKNAEQEAKSKNYTPPIITPVFNPASDIIVPDKDENKENNESEENSDTPDNNDNNNN